MLAIRPETAVLAESGREVAADDVAVGELLLVRPGAKVALDGVVQKGSSTVDESMLTGDGEELLVGDGAMSCRWVCWSRSQGQPDGKHADGWAAVWAGWLLMAMGR